MQNKMCTALLEQRKGMCVDTQNRYSNLLQHYMRVVFSLKKAFLSNLRAGFSEDVVTDVNLPLFLLILQQKNNMSS